MIKKNELSLLAQRIFFIKKELIELDSSNVFENKKAKNLSSELQSIENLLKKKLKVKKQSKLQLIAN
jgi:hypothetical protein